MGAFDRLQNYSAMRTTGDFSDVFDVSTPEGLFLSRVHKLGYAMYEESYVLSSDSSVIVSANEYQALSDEDKTAYSRVIKYTELHDALVCNGNQVVNAIAGSGKTSFLTLKIIHDIVTGEAITRRSVPNGTSVEVVNNMWVCTFLKSGATELQSRLAYLQKKLGYINTASQIAFSTLDAEFKRCLNAMGVATPIGSFDKLFSLFCKAVDMCNISAIGGTSLTKEDYRVIHGIVTYCRGRLDDKKYTHPSNSDYNLSPTIIQLLINQYKNLKEQSQIIDFEDMMELLYKFLYVTPNPAVQDFLQNRYNFIYIDEFQDTSQMAYAILKFYNRGHMWINKRPERVEDPLYTGVETIGKFVIVGDPSQCIYSFRGSDSNIFVKEVEKDFRPCYSYLSINWRCPNKISEPIVPSIHLNDDSKSQKICSARDGGEIYAYHFSSYAKMLDQLKLDISKDLEDGLKVAILCRTNYDGLLPAFSLEMSGKYNFSVSGEGMTLRSPLVKKLLDVSSLFIERHSTAIKNTLQMVSSRAWEVTGVMSVLKQNNMSIWQIPVEDIEYSCPSLSRFLSKIKPHFIKNGAREKEKELDALLQVYSYLYSEVFNRDNPYCDGARTYISMIMYFIESNNFKTIYEYIEEIDFIRDKLEGRVKKDKVDITIATVHEYKGKESDSIYVWNDTKGVFPSPKCDVMDKEQLEEERRVHYIACTRARERQHIYALEHKHGLFANEMHLDWVNPIAVSVSLNKK